MTPRAVFLPNRGQLHELAAHVKSLLDAGESVILVTVHHPASAILQQLRKDGIDPKAVRIIDAAGHGPDGIAVSGTHFVPSPNLLEMVGMRLRRLVQAKGHPNPHVIVIDCDSLAFHNPDRVVEEFLRYVVQHVTKDVPVDVVMAEPSRLPQHLREFLHGFLPDELHLPRAA